LMTYNTKTRDNEEPEDYLPWYKTEYTMKEYIKLCNCYCQSECIDSNTIALFHEMRYAGQHLKKK